MPKAKTDPKSRTEPSDADKIKISNTADDLKKGLKDFVAALSKQLADVSPEEKEIINLRIAIAKNLADDIAMYIVPFGAGFLKVPCHRIHKKKVRKAG